MINQNFAIFGKSFTGDLWYLKKKCYVRRVFEQFCVNIPKAFNDIQYLAADDAEDWKTLKYMENLAQNRLRPVQLESKKVNGC